MESSNPREPRHASSDINDLPHEIWPLDIAILKTLPHESQMLGGVHYLGRRIADISEELGEYVTSAQINSRMRVSKLNGLTIDRPATGGRVWQRTTKAEELLRQRGEMPPLGKPDEYASINTAGNGV